MNRRLITVAAILWFAVGLFLLTKGISFAFGSNMSPLFALLSEMLNSATEASLIYLVTAPLVGMVKAQMLFRKIVERNVQRIIRLNGKKLSLFHAFSAKDYRIMALMVALGFLMRMTGLYEDIRGFILMAVGTALIRGSMFYIQARGRKFSRVKA